MPIPEETVAASTEIPKIKEKALPTSDSVSPGNVVEEKTEKEVEEKKETEAQKAEDKEKDSDKKVEEVEKSTKAEEEIIVTKESDKKGEVDSVKTVLPEDVTDKAAVEQTVEVAEEAKEKTPKKVVESEAEKQSKEEVAEKVVETSEKIEESKDTPVEKTPTKTTPPVDSEMTDASVDLTPRKAEAFNLLAQGKRHYLVKDFESAVETLGEVCQKFSAIYGETGQELGDVYYYYGISLLELAREESNLLNVDKDDKKEGGDDEEDEEEEEGDEEMPEEDGAAEDKKDDEEKAEEEPKDETLNETAEDGTAADETQEDVNNLELAWEMLELSRSIYAKKENSEVKLADIYLKLSEVSMESENYSAAIEDIEKGLVIYLSQLSPDSRNIAEAYYKLGMAHANNDNYPEAVKQFQLSRETLLKRVELLKTTTKTNEELSKEPFYKKENEIKELETLLPEIDARIEETQNDNKEINKVISNFIGGKRSAPSADGAGTSSSSAGESSSSSASASSKPVSNISHLIKKKRKPEEEIEKTEVEEKKIKLDKIVEEEKPEPAADVDIEMKETKGENVKSEEEKSKVEEEEKSKVEEEEKSKVEEEEKSKVEEEEKSKVEEEEKKEQVEEEEKKE